MSNFDPFAGLSTPSRAQKKTADDDFFDMLLKPKAKEDAKVESSNLPKPTDGAAAKKDFFDFLDSPGSNTKVSNPNNTTSSGTTNVTHNAAANNSAFDDLFGPTSSAKKKSDPFASLTSPGPSSASAGSKDPFAALSTPAMSGSQNTPSLGSGTLGGGNSFPGLGPGLAQGPHAGPVSVN